MGGWLHTHAIITVFVLLQCGLITTPSVSADLPAPPAPDKFGFVWIRIPGGEFTMGANEGDGDERPAHPVRLKDFFLARTETTQAQWRSVTGEAHSSAREGCDDCPVTNVSWDEALAFLEKAGALLGERLRLPTEAEWEYAAGGGSEHQVWAGTNDHQNVRNLAWHSFNSFRTTHPACQKAPNSFGLCDMSGNVWEWCADFYDRSYYEISPAESPAGPSSGEDRVLRGGSWNSPIPITRVTQRFSSWGGAQTPYYGFRPAKDIR